MKYNMIKIINNDIKTIEIFSFFLNNLFSIEELIEFLTLLTSQNESCLIDLISILLVSVNK